MAIPTCTLSFKRLKSTDLIFIHAWLKRYDDSSLQELKELYQESNQQLVLKGTCIDIDLFPLLKNLSRDLNEVPLTATYSSIAEVEVVYEFLNGEIKKATY